MPGRPAGHLLKEGALLGGRLLGRGRQYREHAHQTERSGRREQWYGGQAAGGEHARSRVLGVSGAWGCSEPSGGPAAAWP